MKLDIRAVSPDEDAAWDGFVERSPQGTVFSTTTMLACLEHGYSRYWIERGNEIIAALCFDLDATGSFAGAGALVYSGLMYSPVVSAESPSALHKRFQVAEAVAAWLAENHRCVQIRFAPGITDLRPFTWHAWDAPPEVPRYRVDVTYTSLLAIDDLDGAVRPRLQSVRRQMVRRAEKQAAVTLPVSKPSLILDAYARLDGVAPWMTALMARQMVALESTGRGGQLLTCDGDGSPVYTTYFVWDTKRAYYLYGARVGAVGPDWQGTAALWQGFRWLANRGIREVDLEGVNSPGRGWFKLGFGGSLTPVFRISKGG